jgi:hypothetical protein
MTERLGFRNFTAHPQNIWDLSLQRVPIPRYIANRDCAHQEIMIVSRDNHFDYPDSCRGIGTFGNRRSLLPAGL